MNSSFSPGPGESGVYIDKDVLDLPVPDMDVDYDGDLTPIVKQWTTASPRQRTFMMGRAMSARFRRRRVHTRGIEVGQIFYFGTKYSDSMKALVAGPDGIEQPIHGGSYGVGVSRLVGAIIEACHDETGIKWPDAVAPFAVEILNLNKAPVILMRHVNGSIANSPPGELTCFTMTPTSGQARSSQPLT